ncbi:hypothetical protein LX77_00121 [Gelidibacter algens]|jgi:hypothetical protein|uniref:Uncharacterized protein n=1 Tax=Gelidibacter algens TaxID=49280 RepID=A0A1A7R071_9FLAO|nr:hypothetical protein [Gelidibacter algens]OBX24884.1 hypothetical protein A9996_12890 [Gelidibacter algens]RAJ27549.1 hypothetical protein LX77_00121 [Gelidibacter algens]
MYAIQYKIPLLLLVSTAQLTIVLLITAAVFLFFIALAVIKMYKLKAENKRLTQSDAFKDEVDNGYKDFTDGHLYDNR